MRRRAGAALLIACCCLVPPRTRADVCGKPSKEKWEGECSASAVGGWGEPHGKGFYVREDGSKHEGEFKNGRPVGWGIFTWTNGQRYEGEWKDGQPHGQGVFTWRDGKRYEGMSVNGKHQGKGQFSWPEGETYQGDFLNGHEHGKGLFTSADGSRFCGQFVQGKGSGHVRVRFADGSVYEGQWNDSSIDGYGVSHTNTTVYQGRLQGALPWGEGVLTTHTGLVYKGQWDQGVRNGSGVYEWTDGSLYRGGFLSGRPHGCGVQITPGLLYAEYQQFGRWEEGELSSNARHATDVGSLSSESSGVSLASESPPPPSDSHAATDADMSGGCGGMIEGSVWQLLMEGSVRQLRPLLALLGEETRLLFGQSEVGDGSTDGGQGQAADGGQGQAALVEAALTAAQGAAEQGMEARQTARALLADVPECSGGGIDGHSDSGDWRVLDALPSVLARAAAARHSADKPQAGVAMLLGTLVALTIWILYLLVTWPSTCAPSTCATLQQQREETEEKIRQKIFKSQKSRINKIKSTTPQEGKKTK